MTNWVIELDNGFLYTQAANVLDAAINFQKWAKENESDISEVISIKEYEYPIPAEFTI